MTNTILTQALENIYASLHNDNEGLDQRIIDLKIVLRAENARYVTIDPARIPYPNREGRKMMQSYFRKRGVMINFLESPVSEDA